MMNFYPAAFQTILKSEKIYTPNDIDEVLTVVRPNFRFAYSNKKLKYFNVPCSFDIETSSFYESGEKRAIMYEWTFGIYGAVIIGRTWDEFTTMIDRLVEVLKLNEHKRLVVYVHNLSYEFQFIRKRFGWSKVFAIDTRKPLYALTDRGVEFRCSYLLSGYSLAKLADQLQTVDIKKLVGDLDYTLIRHHKTPLTDAEIAYCVNDVKIVMAYISERIIADGSICKIPLTKTGYVRQYCRESCFYVPGEPRKGSHKRQRYKEIINGMTLDADEYRQLKRAFQGGFTHANPFYSGKIVNEVTSFDFTSSYPTVMIAEKFPMSASEHITINDIDDLNKNLKYYCCLFDIEFINLRPRVWYENYISSSRCYNMSDAIINNGCVVSAGQLRTTITEQDYFIIRKFYVWDEMRVSNFRRYRKDYLPTDFIKSILQLYKDKTTLKGVEGKDAEYLSSKEMLNSCYGMSVTDIVRDEITYSDDWNITAPDVLDAIIKYNKNPNRFLYYPWGVWVTAYARRNLFSGILACGIDYVYSDTDSIKIKNANDHTTYINDYNRRIKKSLFAACDYHGIDYAEIEPETIKGVKKCLGVWDFDGHYSKFKTLGAKRYMVQYADTGKISLTVSGLNKKICVPYMLDKYGNNIFNAFSDDLYVPPEFTGKNTHTYLDEERRGAVKDYRGEYAEYHELSAVHMEQADYTLSISKEYADYLRNIREESI